MLRSDAKLPNEVLGIVASASFPLAMWLFGINGVVVMVSLFIIVLLVWYVFWLHARIVDVAVSLFGAFYTGLLMSAAMLIRVSVPRLLGRRAHPWYFRERVGQRCLRLSYRLEVRQAQDDTAGLAEENLGRLLCRFLSSPWRSGACSRSFLESRSTSPSRSCSARSVACSALSAILVESRIKRNAGFKQFRAPSTPGHGGLLDRCDSQFLVTLGASMLLIFGNSRIPLPRSSRTGVLLLGFARAFALHLQYGTCFWRFSWLTSRAGSSRMPEARFCVLGSTGSIGTPDPRCGAAAILNS